MGKKFGCQGKCNISKHHVKSMGGDLVWGFGRKYSSHIKEVFAIVGDILATVVCGHLYIIYVVRTFHQTVSSMACPKIFAILIVAVMIGVAMARPGHLGGYYGGYGHHYPYSYGYPYGYGHYGYGGFPYYGFGYGHYGHYF
ncbi:hypothetical protein PV326_002009 [Microctonus aethiopoides]|uniref:Uncharacterized protein n=1 Tax=Microctonus aethiopoides TaxID=144406 RepID=A0AA39KT90_9HYME|nr:hypothetical protein PV326_002009 [Microctonus aethiopoides]KAK0172766.1 hypothetical protein PV328_006044 [Microctonus aethiopoides]